MALLDYVVRTRSILEGYGLGEKPIVLQVAADALNTVSNQTVVIAMTSNAEAAKVRAGDVVQTHEPSSEAVAWLGYALSISSANVTFVNGYQGTTDIANAATTHDNGLLQLLGGQGATSCYHECQG